jgi:hypothetical protein
MQFNKFFKNFGIISKEYKFFALLIAISICCAYGLFVWISFKNHKNTYEQKYLSLSVSIANSYEVFLDNIFRQAEFIGHKIDNDSNQTTIKNLLKHNFSLNTNLDTSLLTSWVKFNWIPENSAAFFENYNFSLDKKESWIIHFKPLHSTGLEKNNKYLPITFGITNKNGRFIGSLESSINIATLMTFLQRNIQDKTLNIIILDQENNVIGQSSNHISLPQNFFKEQKFKDKSGNIYSKFDLANEVYVAYKKLDSYPFTILVGDNKDVVFSPLKNTLLKYFLVLLCALFAILFVLLVFYEKIITPIISLSSFAKSILISDEKTNYIPGNHSFIEISNLEQALIKIEDFKKQLSTSNKELNQKTGQLEDIKKNLEEELKKLANAYSLRDNLLKKSLEKTENVAVKEAISKCLTMLYPEIYSRQLKIIDETKNLPNLSMQYCDFVKVVTDLLSRSFIFSKKNTEILIKTDLTKVDNIDHFCLMIEDSGIGDEEWRKKSLDKSCELEELRILLEKYKGILKCVNNKESGVKYCVLIPYTITEKVKSNDNSEKIIHLFPRK